MNPHVFAIGEKVRIATNEEYGGNNHLYRKFGAATGTVVSYSTTSTCISVDLDNATVVRGHIRGMFPKRFISEEGPW